MPLHLRLVLVNGLVFAGGVLVMSLAPEHHRGATAIATLLVGLTLIVAVNTRHLRQSLAPMTTAIGNLRGRWESERRSVTARSLASREYDGQRMAAQLRDNVGNNLAAALVGLKKAIDHAPPELAAELRSVQQSARVSLVEMRRISRPLRPELLEDCGLQSALSRLATDLTTRHPGLKVRRRLEGPSGIDAETELVVYRVAEEALTNIGRHAKAKHVELCLAHERDTVVLRVCDDGVGIDAQTERTGILSMRERAALVGGRLEVSRQEGGGTQVRLEVPARPVAG